MEEVSRSALEVLIREVIHELLEMPITPHVRELRAKAVTYGRVVDGWATYPPTSPQVQAMRECIDELREKVQLARREESRVSRKPSAPAGAGSSGSHRPAPSRSSWGAPERPETIPPGVAWNANVNDATGVRPITRREREETRTPSETPAVTSRPPAGTQGTGTVPPVSHPRPIHTPPPALLKSRRSR